MTELDPLRNELQSLARTFDERFTDLVEKFGDMRAEVREQATIARFSRDAIERLERRVDTSTMALVSVVQYQADQQGITRRVQELEADVEERRREARILRNLIIGVVLTMVATIIASLVVIPLHR